MKKYLAVFAALTLGACALFQSATNPAQTQHDADLLMCQEEGRAASRACVSDGGDAGVNCDHVAIVTYDDCKASHNL